MLSLQPNLDFAYNTSPATEEDYLANINTFLARCEAIGVEIYFNAEDIPYRSNLQGILSTVCMYGEEEMKQVVVRNKRNGTLTKQAGLKNMKDLKLIVSGEIEPEAPPPVKRAVTQ